MAYIETNVDIPACADRPPLRWRGANRRRSGATHAPVSPHDLELRVEGPELAPEPECPDCLRAEARRREQGRQRTRIVRSVIELVGEGGYAAVGPCAIRDRGPVTFFEFRDVCADSDEAILEAYNDISRDLLEELEACGKGISSREAHAASCVSVLVDFARTGGAAADLWFLVVRQASLEVRDRRAIVVAEIAELIALRATGSRRKLKPTRDLMLLGGILEVLAGLRAERDLAGMRMALPSLIEHAWSTYAPLES